MPLAMRCYTVYLVLHRLCPRRPADPRRSAVGRGLPRPTLHRLRHVGRDLRALPLLAPFLRSSTHHVRTHPLPRWETFVVRLDLAMTNDQGRQGCPGLQADYSSAGQRPLTGIQSAVIGDADGFCPRSHPKSLCRNTGLARTSL